jgi:hypothetical protein
MIGLLPTLIQQPGSAYATFQERLFRRGWPLGAELLWRQQQLAGRDSVVQPSSHAPFRHSRTEFPEEVAFLGTRTETPGAVAEAYRLTPQQGDDYGDRVFLAFCGLLFGTVNFAAISVR